MLILIGVLLYSGSTFAWINLDQHCSILDPHQKFHYQVFMKRIVIFSSFSLAICCCYQQDFFRYLLIAVIFANKTYYSKIFLNIPFNKSIKMLHRKKMIK